MNGSDPSGLAGIGLMSDWNPQEFHKNNTPDSREDVFTDALINSIEANLGIGMGARVGGSIINSGLDAGFSHNFAEVYFEDGKLGVRQTERSELVVDVGYYEIGFGNSSYKDMNFNQIPSPENWKIFRYKTSLTIFEANLYVAYGFSCKIGINWEKFYKYLEVHS